MSLKLILTLLTFSLLSIYIAFLNPVEVEVFLTQSRSVKMPMVILFFGSVLVGVLITAIVYWAVQMKRSYLGFRMYLKQRRETLRGRKLEQLFERAENACTTGHSEKAADYFDKILKIHPRHTASLYLMGNLARERGDVDRAIGLHQTAAEAAPQNLKLLHALAEDYSAANDPVKEMEILNKLREADRRSAKPLEKIRALHESAHSWTSAAEVQKKILSLSSDPDSRKTEAARYSRYQFEYARELLLQEKKDAAMEELKRAIKEDPACLPAHMELGDLQLAEGKTRQAVKTWKTGYQHTGSPACLTRIQRTLKESEDLAEMVKIYREVLQSADNSNREILQNLLASVLLETGKTGDALALLEENNEEGSLYRDLLRAETYREKEETRLWEQSCQAIYGRIRNSLVEYYCVACAAPRAEWSSHCPRCKAWNSLKPRPAPAAGHSPSKPA